MTCVAFKNTKILLPTWAACYLHGSLKAFDFQMYLFIYFLIKGQSGTDYLTFETPLVFSGQLINSMSAMFVEYVDTAVLLSF